jgi:acyl-CoA synthetase (AMP-forming)/AMP-acid ligase II
MNAGYFLTRAAERYPDHPAWIDARRVVTFREAADRVGRLAQVLASLGGQPGDRVGLLMPNCPEGLEAILAPIQAGMAAVPMNIRLHPDEHAYMLNDSGAFALIAGAEFRSPVSRMRERLETV